MLLKLWQIITASNYTGQQQESDDAIKHQLNAIFRILNSLRKGSGFWFILLLKYQDYYTSQYYELADVVYGTLSK